MESLDSEIIQDKLIITPEIREYWEKQAYWAKILSFFSGSITLVLIFLIIVLSFASLRSYGTAESRLIIILGLAISLLLGKITIMYFKHSDQIKYALQMDDQQNLELGIKSLTTCFQFLTLFYFISLITTIILAFIN